VLILNFKTSIQRELDSFYKAVSNSDFNIREATKGAFTQARAKLNPWAFKRLNEVAVNTFYNEAEYYVWNSMRVLAVDGSRIALPNHESLIEEFGQMDFGEREIRPRPMAMISMLYDVLNHLSLDSQIAPYNTSERDLLLTHLDVVKKGDLLLLDRGYPSYWLFFLLKAMGVEFCIRLTNSWCIEVKDFVQSNDIEKIVEFRLPPKDWVKLAAYPQIQGERIKCRLIKIELENGGTEILCTSLLDSDKYQNAEIGRLYHYRWNEEETYKLLKSRIELEGFSGKTVKAIKQDFYAKVFLMTLCAAYAHPIEDRVISEYEADKERKHSQKINRTNALSMTHDILVGAFIKGNFKRAIKAFDDIVSKTREIIRPNRSEPRPKKTKRSYSMNYKRL